MTTTSKEKFLLTRRSIIYFYNEIINSLTKAGVNVAEFTLYKSPDRPLNTDQSAAVIREVLSRRLNVNDDPFFDKNNDHMQYLRSASYQLRFSFQGDLRVAALLLKEHLPDRQDVRSSAYKTPRMYTPVASAIANASSAHPERSKLLTQLGGEYTSYLNALIFESTQAESYAAQMRYRQYESAIADLENTSALWYITPDSPEHMEEILLCRTLSEVDHEGVPKQLGNSTSEKIQAIRNLLPALHGAARYNRVKGHPLYRFVSELSDTIMHTLSTSTVAPSVEVEDALIELATDSVILSEDLKISSLHAESLLTRFHHGHPIYKDMIDHLRKQNGLVVATTNDTMRRFSLLYKLLVREGIITSHQIVEQRWWQFFQHTKVMELYEHQCGRLK